MTREGEARRSGAREKAKSDSRFEQECSFVLKQQQSVLRPSRDHSGRNQERGEDREGRSTSPRFVADEQRPGCSARCSERCTRIYDAALAVALALPPREMSPPHQPLLPPPPPRFAAKFSSDDTSADETARQGEWPGPERQEGGARDPGGAPWQLKTDSEEHLDKLGALCGSTPG